MSDANVRVINFVREKDGVLINQTLSTLDGVPKATWTIGDRNNKVTKEVGIDQESFDDLWDQLNEPVFVQHAVRTADAELDFRRNCIVGIIFDVEGTAGQVTYLIPGGETDPVWIEWMERLQAIRRR